MKLFASVRVVAILMSLPVWAQGLDPRHVIDLRAAMKNGLLRADIKLEDLSYSNGRWAVLAQFRNRQSVVVTGSSHVDEISPVLDATFDRIAIDSEHRIYLRKRNLPNSGPTEVTVWDRSTGSTSVAKIEAAQAQPFLSGGTVFWRTAEGLSQLVSPGQQKFKAFRSIFEPTPSLDYAGKPLDQIDFMLGLPGGRHATLGSRTEDIRVYDSDGRLLSTSIADLNTAYGSIGRFIAKFDPTLGRSRIMWAASSLDGKLYICLAELPILGPAVIAVIDPEDGRFLKTISLKLPTSTRRRTSWNPEGVIFPGSGLASNQLVILDSDAFVLSVYEYEN